MAIFVEVTNDASAIHINVNAISAIHAMEDGRTLILLGNDVAMPVDETVAIVLDLIAQAQRESST